MKNYKSCDDVASENIEQIPISNENENTSKTFPGLRVIVCGLAVIAIAAGTNTFAQNKLETTELRMASASADSNFDDTHSSDTTHNADMGSPVSNSDTSSNTDSSSSTASQSSILSGKHKHEHEYSRGRGHEHEHSRGRGHGEGHESENGENSWKRPSNWTEPIDGEATELTALLLDSLRSLALSKAVGFGHQYDNYMGQNYWEPKTVFNMSDVKNTTGKYPMLFGYDFYHLLNGYDWTEHAKWAYQQGAALEISWWSSNPVNDGGPSDCEGSPIKSIMPGGSYHKKWTDQMDTIVKWLNEFVDDLGRPIPIIFRLFREPNEPYWWWGQRCATSEEYLAAWNFTQGYIQKQVHNVLWAYSPCKTSTDFEAALTTWYPGNDMVDIVSIDRYESTPTALKKSIMADCSVLVDFCIQNGKIAAFGELGIMNGLQNVDEKGFFESTIRAGMEDPYCQENLAYVLMWSNFNAGKYWTPLYSQTTGESFYHYAHHNTSAFLSDASWQSYPYPTTVQQALLPNNEK